MPIGNGTGQPYFPGIAGPQGQAWGIPGPQGPEDTTPPVVGTPVVAKAPWTSWGYGTVDMTLPMFFPSVRSKMR